MCRGGGGVRVLYRGAGPGLSTEENRGPVQGHTFPSEHLHIHD